MEPVQHQRCVWSLIKECVPLSELPEIRTVLGDQLIDMYTEMYSESLKDKLSLQQKLESPSFTAGMSISKLEFPELQIWEQIWREAQDAKAEVSCGSLTEPPAVKELLRAELQLLLLTLRNKAATLGRDGDEILSQYSPRVVNYALCNSGYKSPTSRPDSSRSRSSSRLSSCLSLEDEIEALRHKLNVINIDEVVSHLKSVLTEECEALRRDIQFMQENMELEYQKQRKAEFMEPTLRELKQERRLIQRGIQNQNLMSDAMCTKKLKLSSSQISSRNTRLTGFTISHSQGMTSSVSPKAALPLPAPTPPVCRPATLCKLRHRHFSSFAQSKASTQTPTSWLELDLNTQKSQCTSIVSQSGSSSSTGLKKCKEENDPAQATSSTIESEGAMVLQPPLMPAPPTGQKASSGKQRVGRCLAVYKSGNLLSAT